MIQPTNCRQTLFHLWARLHTEATLNVVISLNRAELCESVVLLHRQSILTMHMNDSQAADGLPTKIISYVGEAAHRRKCAELCESVVCLHRQSSLTVFMNKPQTADELPTKLFHLWARLHTDATINETMPLNRAESCESAVWFYTVKVIWLCSWMINRLPTNCQKKYFICGRGSTQTHLLMK